MKLSSIKFSLFFFSLILGYIHNAPAQTYLSNYTNYSIKGRAVQIYAGASSVRFIFYKPEILRIDYLPDSTSVPDSSFVVVQDTTSAAIPSVIETDTNLAISSSDLKIVCTKNPLRFSYDNSSGKLLLSEPSSGGLAKSDESRSATFTLQSDEHLYGTGERGTSLDKRGLAFDSYNTPYGGYSTPLPNMNANIPFMPSSKGYALFFDNTYSGHYDLGSTSSTKYSYTAAGGEMTIYLIAGETIPAQLEQYTWLTGRQPMPPRWALGYIQSKYGYHNDAEARGIVQTMRQKQIPCDAIILDLYWYKKMGDLAWNLTSWPQPFSMMNDFLSTGIKTILITEPYITDGSLTYTEAANLGYVGKDPDGHPYALSNFWACGCNAYLVDLSNPAAQQWWWGKHPSFFGSQVAGIWTDLGEPEKHPNDMLHYLGTAPKLHNVFDLLWAKTIFEGINSLRPNTRFFNLTRSGYAGIQRYGVTIWSGDVGKKFGGLAVQQPMVLNMGMSGIGYHNSDIGGFANGTTTPELYTRWMQYGTFCPVTRAHGEGQATEPWGFDSLTETICKKYIGLRYQLLPYIYTMAYENHQTGMPLTRPLFFDDPTDINLTNESNSYLWGNSILVSPVVQQGQTSKSLYLPKGTWIDFWTDMEIAGGQTITAPAPIETMPIYVKAGSVIPMQFVMNYSDEHPLDTLRLVCYPSVGKSCTYTMYEDDGKTLNYQTGSFAQTEFSQHLETTGGDTSMILDIGKSSGSYTGKPSQRAYIAEVHRMMTKPGTIRKNSIVINEQSSYLSMRQNGDGYYYDSLSKILYIQAPTIPDSAYEIVADNIRLLGVNDNQGQLPSKSFRLDQNYPNPFNPRTNIGFQISENGPVTLKVFDVLGRQVATIVDDNLHPGYYQESWDANDLSSGTYMYQLKSGSDIDTKKFLLLK